MTPITIEIDDVHVTLKSIECNKQYECKCDDYQITCQLKQKLPFRPSTEYLMVTELLLNVRNASTEAFPIGLACWELIDTDGFAYNAQAICDALRPPRAIDLNSYEVASPGTQVNLVLLFPELEGKTQIACLSFRRRLSVNRARDGSELYLFEINKSKRKAADLVNARESLRIDARSAGIERCKAYLDQLQQDVQRRLTETLTRAESVSLDRKIKSHVEAIQQTLPRIKPPERTQLDTVFQATLAGYPQAVANIQELAEERRKATQTIEGLRRLAPGEFEAYVRDLLETLGYQKVTLRGGSGDQGADVLAEKNGDKVAIQCKRYKGMVGPHEVRALIGAMGLADAQRGLLITTGMFSIQAEKIADEAPIETIDGNKLIELIAQARAK